MNVGARPMIASNPNRSSRAVRNDATCRSSFCALASAATTRLPAEQQWHAEERSVAALDEEPVTRAPRIQLTLSIPDENDLAATDALQDGIIFDGRHLRALRSATDQADLLESVPVGSAE